MKLSKKPASNTSGLRVLALMCGRCGGSIWLILRRGFFDDLQVRPFQNF